MDTKALSWLLFALALLLSPILFAVVALGGFMIVVIAVAMYAFFASSFLILFRRKRSLKNSYLLLFLAGIIVPLLVAYFAVMPFLSSVTGVLYICMHFVFAAGAVTAYLHQSKFKKLF